MPDAEDAVQFSNVDTSVGIGGCNTGVRNQVTTTGATFNDLIAAAKVAAKNQGIFVKAVVNLTGGKGRPRHRPRRRCHHLLGRPQQVVSLAGRL